MLGVVAGVGVTGVYLGVHPVLEWWHVVALHGVGGLSVVYAPVRTVHFEVIA